MYVIYPADQVVSLTYTQPAAPRPRKRPTLDLLSGPTLHAPDHLTSPISTTAPPERPERAPASPTPSLDRPNSKLKEKAKNKFLKKLGRVEDTSFGKITRAPALDDFELPAPLPTPAFSRENIFGRDFDALFKNAVTPEFDKNVRVVTPELERRSDVSAPHFPSSISLTPPTPTRPHSAPDSIISPASSVSTPTPQRSSREGSICSTSARKKVSFFKKWSLSRESPSGRGGRSMTVPAQVEMALRELTHPAHNDHLKNHNAVSFKLVKTVSDFTSQLSHLYEAHTAELQVLVSNFRKKNSELRKERLSCPSSLFHTWDNLLQEVEADVVSCGNAAAALEREVARPLLDKTFHMKLQARKVFAHRDGCETILNKADDQLAKSRQDYRTAFVAYSTNPNPTALAAYYDSHNNYVQQLTATNAMLDQYHRHTLPTILQELEEIFADVTSAVSDAICQSSEVIAGKCTEQHRRYESLCAQARAVSSTADLAHFARTLLTQQPQPKAPRRVFVPPYPPAAEDPPVEVPQENMPPVLRHEMIMDRIGATQIRLSYEQLRKDTVDLETQIKQLQDSLDSLARIQSRSLDSSLYNKVSEIQEDISLKKYDYRAAQLHLAAVRAQKELFAAKAESSGGGAVPDRKLSSSSAGSMKNKWLKAFRSLKPPSAPPPPQPIQEKRNGAARETTKAGFDTDAHNFQENTYKKITPCDVCSQVLRGHTRQGLRCKLCKMNVHVDCISQVGKCQTKSKLLRRQKSTSEIDSRIHETPLEEERFEDGWLPGQRISRLSFKDAVEFDDDEYGEYYEESEETSTRPFGQPLCFPNENGEAPPSILKSSGSIRHK